MDLSAEILSLLTALEDSLKCPICSRKPTEPVRIKTCGHYFCNQCLKSSKQPHNCPKCDEVYDNRDLDYNNLAKKSEVHLSRLRELLESTPIDDTQNTFQQNTIYYKHNEYHVNFTNEVHKTNAKGESALHLACKKKKLDEVMRLIDLKVDINSKDYAGWAPLHEAVQSESLQIVEYLLEKGCLVNIPGADFVTPLHQASTLNNIDIVRLLLKYGADKNMVDYKGLKPEDWTKEPAVKSALKSQGPVCNQSRLFEVFLPRNVSLYCHSIDDDAKKKLEDCNALQVVDKVNMKKKLTHFVIKKTHKVSFKIMQAMLEGLQFVTQDSVDDYIRGDYFINIPEHTFLQQLELNEGIRASMMSALLKLPKLFEGINFYIEGHQTPIDVYHLKVEKEYLTKLIKAGGGAVLHRPPATRTCDSELRHPFFSKATFRCCNFIIFPENSPPELLYGMNELQHRSSKWLIDCVIRYEISE